jgi:divalent metal cation (Fe/Co/Zn/Cd) transporter
MVGNTAVLIAKVGAYLYSGSGAMLSEAIHSGADVANQVYM